ncbi:unnamed protein product [Owenia fusiformis]|uniref:Uncharacterized protein n=1 Tax=Owenia fusiformis TaxID=6347 RepID=A0A8J1TZH5_OWEFU|nr:unnamed protein product [Owenia fusiformis]
MMSSTLYPSLEEFMNAPTTQHEDPNHNVIPSAPPENELEDVTWVCLNLQGTKIPMTIQSLNRLNSSVIERLLKNQTLDDVYWMDLNPDIFKHLMNMARSSSTGQMVNRNQSYNTELVEMATYLDVGKHIMNSISNGAHLRNKKTSHHNQLEITVSYIHRQNNDKRFWHIVDSICCEHELNQNIDCDITKYINGYNSNELIYKYQIKDLSVTCLKCYKHIPLQTNLGWCHVCRLCRNCQGAVCIQK